MTDLIPRADWADFDDQLGVDVRAVLAYLAQAANGGETGPVSLRGMLGPDRAALPREEFDPADWSRWADLYFAVGVLVGDGLVHGVAGDGGPYPDRFAITDAGRAALGADARREQL